MEADNITVILENLSSPDSKQRQPAIADFIKYVNDEDKSLKPEEIHQSVAALAISIKDNNMKICQAAMGAVETLVAYLTRTNTPAAANTMTELVDPIAERLGDSSVKSHVRMIAHDVLISLMTVLTPGKTLTHLKEYFAHKNHRVREMVIQLVHKTIEKFGKSEVRPDEWIDYVIAGLEDPQNSVREAALKAIEGIYKLDHSLRALLEAKNISKPHWDLVRAKLDAVDGIKQAQVVSPRSTLTSSRGSKHLSMEIKPIRISTEAELQKELEAMKNIFGVVDEWEQRVDNLKKLQQMAQMGLHLSFPNFINYLKDLQDALAAQIGDLRSSVVKEACITLALLASNLGESFNSFVEFFFPSLLKLTFVTIQVVSDAGDSCMKVMLKYTKPNIVSKITAEAMKSKHSTSRLRCNEYILLVLKDKSKSYLDKYVEDIEQAIKKCVSDADKDVRSCARACYCWFAKTWPDRGDRLLKTFDGTTQKYIAEEQARVLSQSTDELRTSGSTVQPSGYKRVPVGKEKTAKSQATVTGMTKSGAMRVELPLSKSNPSFSTSGETPAVVPKATTAQRVPVADKPWKKKPTAQPASAKGAAPPNKLQKSDGNEAETPVAVAPTEPLAITDDLLIFDTNSFAAPSNTNQPKPTTALRISQQKDVNEELVAGNFDEKWQLINTNAANAQNWSLRVDAFAELKAMCGSDVFNSHVLNNPVKNEKLIKLYSTHLFDPHFKVVNQCLDSLIKLVSGHPKYTDSNWDKIAPHVLKLLGGQMTLRDDTRQYIQQVVDVLAEVSGSNSSSIFNTTSKLLDSNDNKIKTGVMKFLELFSNVAEKQNLASANVKQALKKILTCVKWDKASDMRKAAVDSLIAIYPVNPSQFKSQISTFNNAQREDLVKLLLPKIPTLLEEEPEPEDKAQDKVQESTENLTSSGNLITSRKQVENGLEELSPTCDFDINSPNKVPTTEVETGDVTNNNTQLTEHGTPQSEGTEGKQTSGDDMTSDAETNHVVAEPLSTPSSTEILNNNSNVTDNNNNAKTNNMNAEDDLDIDLTAAKEALEKPKVDLSSLAQLLESSSAVERGNGFAALIDHVIDDEHDRPRQQAAVKALQNFVKTRADLHQEYVVTVADMLTARKQFDGAAPIYTCVPILALSNTLRERVTKANAAVLSVFQAVLVHMSAQDTIDHVMSGPWFATLMTAFEKGDPAVRKTAVFCFVEISVKLDPSKYKSYFSSKNASHIKLQKLVDVYTASKTNGVK
jgi:hypothetical protein